MYIFEAHYIYMPTGDEVTRKIEFHRQFHDSERERYLYAMGEAYDMIGEDEEFISLEFIAC